MIRLPSRQIHSPCTYHEWCGLNNSFPFLFVGRLYGPVPTCSTKPTVFLKSYTFIFFRNITVLSHIFPIFPLLQLTPHPRSSQAELPNYGKCHELPGNTDVITTITIYLKDCADNRTLNNLILMLPYTSYTSLLHMEIILNHLQDLTDHPMAMIISYIKATNALFWQLFPLLIFEPIITAGIQKNLMSDLLRSIKDATSTFFITKYQAF